MAVAPPPPAAPAESSPRSVLIVARAARTSSATARSLSEAAPPQADSALPSADWTRPSASRQLAWSTGRWRRRREASPRATFAASARRTQLVPSHDAAEFSEGAEAGAGAGARGGQQEQ